MIYLNLFWEFLKVGLFTVGGGLASLPFLYDISDKTGWFSHAQLADMIAVSESTPGPIGINMATYVGFSTAGIFGSIAATIGFIIPSIIIVSIVSKFLKKFNENKFVKGAFYGLRAVSVALICSALFSVVKISLIDIPLFEQTGVFFDLINIPGIILAVICFFVLKKYNPHPIVILGASAAAGIIFGFLGIM
ncbi:MAG: chromate transporter [Oscillospiraceae bacterium]|nr:chromate transporter [Oscillospiraceae bacterium]